MKADREFTLAVECCRSSLGGRDTGAITTFDGVEWERFAHVVRFHRIQGLAWSALERTAQAVPPEIAGSLAQDARAIAAQNLQSTAASGELLEKFETARVPLLFLKGATLGALAYGNPAVKAAIDIDLLIDPAHLSKAANLLREGGFLLTAPGESSDDCVLRSWHRLWKESVWTTDPPRLQVDLHTRAADNRRLIPSVDVHSPSQSVDVGNGVRLPTLARDELFAYLAVHGASSAWFRLKWITDFASLLHGLGAEELHRLYRRSQELRAGRSAGLALLLAHHLFDTLVAAPTLREDVCRDGITVRLYRTALRLLTSDLVEPTERHHGTLPIHLIQSALLPGLAFKLSELSRQGRQMLSRAS